MRLANIAHSIWCLLFFTSASLASIRDRDVQEYVRNMYIVIDGVDAILDGSLAQNSGINNFSWLDIFRILLAVDKIVENIKSEEYGRAILEANKSVAVEVLSQITSVSRISSIMAVANLASLPITLGLKKFAEQAQNDALNWQIQRYIQVRSPPLGRSHAFVMRGEGDDQIFFADGWIHTIDTDTVPRGYLPKIPPYPPERVYKLAQAIFEARFAISRASNERKQLEKEFSVVLERAALALRPPQFLKDTGACPFECCTYGTWTAITSTIVHATPELAAEQITALKSGETVEALTGEVHVTPSKFAVLKEHGRYKPGDELWVYTYLGEGIFKIWFRGQIYEEALGFSPYGGSPGSRCADSPQCWGRLESELASVWWIQLRTKDGKMGWTTNAEHFTGKDRCGG